MDMEIISARIEKEEKELANQMLKEMGLNMSTFITMAVKQLINKKAIPFSVELPNYNMELLESIKEADQIVEDIRNGKRQPYNDVNKLFEDILNEKHKSRK